MYFEEVTYITTLVQYYFGSNTLFECLPRTFSLVLGVVAVPY